MNNAERPLAQYFEKTYKEEYTEIVQSNIPDDISLEQTIMLMLSRAYMQGFSDGAGQMLMSKIV